MLSEEIRQRLGNARVNTQQVWLGDGRTHIEAVEIGEVGKLIENLMTISKADLSVLLRHGNTVKGLRAIGFKIEGD